MRRARPLRALAGLAAALTVLAGIPQAGAQTSDTFNGDAAPGPWWLPDSGNSALSATEANNRLQFSTTPAPNLATESFAGYVGKNWRVRATSEIRARVRFRSNPTGISATNNSEAGILFAMFPAASARQSTAYRSGLTVSVGAFRFANVGVRRDFNVNYINATGAVTNLYRFWAYYTNTPTTFYNFYSGNLVGNIGVEGTLYLQYLPASDALIVSVAGYNDPNAPVVSNATLGIRDPQQFAVGGYAALPDAVSGADAWIDDFYVDMGVIEAPPSNVSAEDGTNATRVRVTWTAAPGATGYRILRNETGGTPTVLGTLGAAATSFDDTTAVPGTTYTYTVRMITPSGDAFEATDTGWRGLVPPTAVTASDGTTVTGVNVTWTGASGAQQYAVFRAVGTASATEIGTSTASPFEDTYAEAGTVYTYSVRSRSPAGDSAASASDTGWRNVPPPSGVQATDGTSTSEVTITWTPVSGVIGYRVLRAAGSGTPAEIGTPTAASFADTTAVAGTPYTYTVRARTAAGDSAASASDAGWRGIPAPTALAATDGTLTTGVSLSWTGVGGATGYRVLRSLDGGTPSDIGTPTATAFTDSTAEPGVVYVYAVAARAAAGDSQPSVTDTGWRNVPAPASVAASDGTSASAIDVTWSPVSGATGYRILRAIGAGTPAEVGTAAAASFSDSSASPATSYSYSVRAITAAGDSASSAADTGWRNVAAPAAVSASDGTSTSAIEISWDAVPQAIGYRVLRSTGGGPATEIAAPSTAALVDSTAIAGTTYSYRVRARTALGDSAVSEPDSGWRNVPAPAGLVATDGTSTSEVTLAWSPVAGATGYRVLRSEAGGAEVEIAAPASTGHSDTGAVAGTPYTYTIRARTAPGDSAPSAPDSGWRNVPPPAQVAATDGTMSSGVKVTWARVPGAAGYRVLRASGSGSAAEIAAPAGATHFDSTAAPGTIYTYTVRVRMAAGDSASSEADQGWRTVGAPTSLSATDGTRTDGVQLTWSPVQGATSYIVYRSDGVSAPQVIATPVQPSLLDGGAAQAVEYVYTVRAYTAVVAPPPAVSASGSVTGGSGQGSTSGSGSAPRPAPQQSIPGVSAPSFSETGWRNVPAPETVAATDGTFPDRVQVSWTAVSGVPGVTGYRIFRSLPGGSTAAIGTVPADTLAFSDTSIPLNVIGTYSVRTTHALGTSAASATDTGFRSTSLAGDAEGDAGDSRSAGSTGLGDGATAGPGAEGGAGTSSAAEAGSGASFGEQPGVDGRSHPAITRTGPAALAGCTEITRRLRLRILSFSESLSSGGPDEAEARRPLVEALTHLLGGPAAGDGADADSSDHAKTPSQASRACMMADGDVTLDGRVDEEDVARFLRAWADLDEVLADLDRDGRIGADDLRRVLGGG